MCDVLMDSLPSLVGTVVGAAIGAAATLLGNYLLYRFNKQLAVEEYSRRKSEKQEDFQFELWARIQEQGNALGRAAAVAYLQLRQKFKEGADYSSAIIDDAASEQLRSRAMEFRIYEERIKDDNLRLSCKQLRMASNRIAYESNDAAELERYMREFLDLLDIFNTAVGKEIRNDNSKEAVC